jgi:uncharacterized repeat protein (TIGR01451 family)
MNPRRTFLPLLFLAISTGGARTQWAPPPLPGRGPAPLLFVRFSGPAGMRTTFYQGVPGGRGHEAPVVVGLRPGYVYRVKLSNLPGRPGVNLYPAVEVRGSLCLPPGVNALTYPAPVELTETDVEQVAAGALITKVVYLENPQSAEPVATRPGQVRERDVPADRDLMAEARTLGRPVLVVRLGEREMTEQDLLCQNVPGTVLQPGETVLAPARLPPCLPCFGPAFYDPRLGPRHPEEECLHDGGDHGIRAGLGHDGQLLGLEPEDTVAEYTDSRGRRSIVCSNRVCLCVPRYVVLRSALLLGRYETVVGPDQQRAVRGQEQVRLQVPSLQAKQFEQPGAVQGQKRPTAAVATEGLVRITRLEVLQANEVNLGPAALLGTAEVQRLTEVERLRLARQVQLARELSQQSGVHVNEQVTGTTVVARVAAGPEIIKATAETRDLTICCEEPRLPDKPLVLWKCADRQSAQVGDVVTFTLRYSNHGGQPMTDVAVTDSLTARLEYVPGSAQSDRAAVFTLQENEAGSVILRWEVSGRLLPGQSGVVRFRARVR